MKDYFEKNPIPRDEGKSSKEKSTITKIFKHKKKQNVDVTPIPSKILSFQDENKTSTPIQVQVVTPKKLNTSQTSNKKKFAPVLPARENVKLYESHKQYMNPFDSSDDDTENDFNDFNTNPFKNEIDNESHHAPIIEIKQNGEIIDALSSEFDCNNE